jgi:NAD(P)-dependent dehydrogenase (short-subunit alcohol dehydrogenase family)/acyl carrier protein
MPPVANFREVDPELGLLNLSRGGAYPVRYALRLAAGFGSQVAMALFKWVPTQDGRRRQPSELGYAYRIADATRWCEWLSRISGDLRPELEVVQHTLRVKDQSSIARTAKPAPVVRSEPVITAAPATPAPPPIQPTPGVTASAAKAVIEVVAETPVAVPTKPSTAEQVKEHVLALVAEKTGYPTDMLDLDLDLEADLGIDTVKQAEIFAAIRERYGIRRDDKLKLRDFPTLTHVIRFVYDRRPDLKTAEEQTSEEPGARSMESVAADDDVTEKVLALVAEKTGYPPDMLDLDLDLEADLGIDTVKQAEIMATVRASYGIPRDDKLKLRDFPTLAHVIRFVNERRSDRAPVADEAMTDSNPKSEIRNPKLEMPRRVPVPVPRPPLNFCKPTGVTLGPGSRVIVMSDRGGVSEALGRELQARGVETLTVDGAPDAETLTAIVQNWIANGPVQGVYWLPALDDEGDIRNMDLTAWREALRVRVKLLYTTMRALYEQIGRPGTFLVSAARLGGQHGYDDAGAVAPLGGPVVGFTKTYKRERTDALVKAVDFEPGRSAAEVAQLLIEETLSDPGAVEVEYKTEQRWTVGLQEQSVSDGESGLPLTKETVFVITGAAGGIVSAITADLAAASGGTFYLLDKVPEPDPNNSDIERLVTDKENLKRDLFERIKARGERATPALVEKELFALERAQTALAAIRAVQEAGGVARYFSVDLMDADAVAEVIAEVRRQNGRIDALVHAAGLEISHHLPDKEPREFDLVFDVKCDGWFNLLRAIGDMPLGATVAFSSVAGRFGNADQTDYSAANDLLCKTTSSFRTTRPGTRGLAIDWTAWGGIGMATRGSIPKMMEAAGIDMLAPEAGIPIVRRELTAGARGEIVIGQRLGVLLNEWDESGGLETAAVESQIHGPMIGKVVGMGLHNGLTVEMTLDPTAQPFLHDHQIDGTPTLPGVMGIEAFAEIAALVLPGWQAASIEDVNFLSPFKFYRSQPRTLTLNATFHTEAETLVAECCLIGSRTLPTKPEPEVTTHFTGRVRLTRKSVGSEELRVKSEEFFTHSTLHSSLITLNSPAAGLTVSATDIYRVYFHGPAYQVLESAWRDGERVIGLMAHDLPANHSPADLPMLAEPRLIELCFQTAGIWEIGTQGWMGLPQHVDRVSVSRNPDLASDHRLFAVVTPNVSQKSFDAQVADAAGHVYITVHGYRTVQLPDGIEGQLRMPLQIAMV